MATAPIGEAISRVDAPLKVTGGATYAADNNPANLAYGYLILSTIGLGAVTAMDTAAALAAPGVLDVYTPFHPLQLFAYGGDENDESFPPLQTTDVRYYGQVIGMVVADTFEQARDAAALVTTTYALKTPLTSLTSGPATPVTAPVTVTQNYTTAIVHHHAMEPHATVASWAAGHLTINTVTQSAPLVVSRLSHTLGTDASKIHVINPYVGGAFGGKWGNWAHTPLTAAAARVLDRPVKTVLTREQVFTVVGHRPETTQTVSIGASTDGVLTAIQQRATASKSNSSNFTENPAGVANTSYAAGTISTSNTHVPLDLPATTIMRAPGEANGAFALESAMDELAVALALDPLALRQKNYANTVPNNGQPWSSKHLAECYDIGAQRFGWSKRNPTPGAVTDGDWLVGLGMATATYPAFLNQAAQKVRFVSDGTVVVSST
ncbi:MAG TPA: molybdopterin cofactor-binding domain-containing protein, partial [Pseudonocardiaceae bacterium]|nr:molybdopterin cofactor-binding domain-containing protein [Pseudonocardiaceae bacterium]